MEVIKLKIDSQINKIKFKNQIEIFTVTHEAMEASGGDHDGGCDVGAQNACIY